VYRNSWCPSCSKKSEAKLHAWLLKEFDGDVKVQFKPEWSRNPETKYPLAFDFLVHDHIIIELDGEQHFNQVLNWQSPDDRRAQDTFKALRAYENDFSMIRLLQTDVLFDTNDWGTQLYVKIQELVESKSTDVVYICHDKRYDLHVSDLEEAKGGMSEKK
jgi:very-short-patch-repair endonuclease